MSDNQRYRSGPVEEIKAFVKTGVKVEIGDLVALTGAAPGVVESFTSSGLTAATFQDKFFGVLVQGATRGGETTSTPCLVYTAGEFWFPLSAPAGAALAPGTLVSASANQAVTTGAAAADAIGRTVGPISVGQTACLIKIESVIMKGGPQAAA